MRYRLALGLLALVVVAAWPAAALRAQRASDGLVPRFRVDPFWPKPLPNRWLLGQVSGVAVDASDHVWIVQRPRSLTDDERGATLMPPRSVCCAPAPPVMEFDLEGNLLQAWGGPGAGYDWPASEHGIFVDHTGHVWLAGNGDETLSRSARSGRYAGQLHWAHNLAVDSKGNVYLFPIE